jgi:hypothetical protein
MTAQQIDFAPTTKQFQALEYLFDSTTTEILYGGSVSSGKSRIACYYLILSCLKYPGTRHLLGRARLLNLKRTTLRTFLDISREWGIEHLYDFNRQDNVIKFNNGSEIILMDLFQYPSDEVFVKLGSLEITSAIIDEAGEVSEKAYKILKTRLRYKLNEYNLIPKLFICSNPSKNWLYNIFYKPFKEDELPSHRKFIQALPSDNQYNSKEYLKSLTPENLGSGIYQMLVLGNWDYANTDYDLFNHDAVINSFYATSPSQSSQRYITIYPASMGKDSTVITYWIGYDCLQILNLEKNDTNQIVNQVKQMMMANNVPIRNVIVDRVGIGVGVYDGLKGCQGFVANATAFAKEPFNNLKSQVFYKFAELLNNGQIGFVNQTDKLDEVSIQLEAHKRHNAGMDRKAEVTPKPIVKQMLGKSPDIADALTMRAFFEYASGAVTRIVGGR